jgi:hypothetical protein
MAYFLEPGHISMVMLTPEQYMRMYQAHGPSMWPVYFGARMTAQTIQDLAMKKMQVEDIGLIQSNIGGLLSTGFEAADAAKKGGPTGDVWTLRDVIERIYGGLYDNWKAGIWKGVGGAYSSAMDNFMNAGQLVYAYKTLMYHTAVTPRMRRYWNTIYTPMVPDASMAYVLYRRGRFDHAKFVQAASWDGWDKEGAELLLDAMELLPSPREAFYLWAKGHISRAQRDALYTAGGYDSRWHTPITENWYYVPTLYDLMRMADYVELDQIWTMKQLRKRGIRDSDAAKMWEMLELRPLSYEIRGVTNIWLWRRKYGRATEDDLEAAFLELGIRRKKREILIEQANLNYEDELVNEWIEILRWRFRTAIITEEAFLESLIDLGIAEEKANLIVELEKAKGYYGYY